MNAPSFSNLQANLYTLKKSAALDALKTGTEIEDMGFEEIAFLRDLSKDLLPLYVKIGGPEARNDIRTLRDLQVDGLIAPMVESVYALQKFVESLKDLLNPNVYRSMRKGINIETIEAVHKLDDILTEAQTLKLDQVTAARSDLSASMSIGIRIEEEKLSVNDAQVMENCAFIVKGAQDYGIQSSVGGQIDPLHITDLLAYLNSDFINTRHMHLSSRALKALEKDSGLAPDTVLVKNLEFECALYSHLAELFPGKRGIYEERIFAIQQRIQKKTLISKKASVLFP